jgi:hypothetical protein
MRKVPLLLASIIVIMQLQQGQLSPGWTRVECACEEGDFACRITNCKGIGSGTGTGSSGTSAFDRDRSNVLREPREPREPKTDRPNSAVRDGSGGARDIR